METTEKQLLELKEKIDKAKKKQVELETTKNHLLKEAKEDWSCENKEDILKELENSKEGVKELEGKIAKGLEELEEKYDFENETTV